MEGRVQQRPKHHKSYAVAYLRVEHDPSTFTPNLCLAQIDRVRGRGLDVLWRHPARTPVPPAMARSKRSDLNLPGTKAIQQKPVYVNGESCLIIIERESSRQGK